MDKGELYYGNHSKRTGRQTEPLSTAVSMALNGKPGVSTETRAMVIREAEKAGYDFSRLSMKKNASGDIYCIICRAHNAILNYTPIFSELTDASNKNAEKTDTI